MARTAATAACALRTAPTPVVDALLSDDAARCTCCAVLPGLHVRRRVRGAACTSPVEWPAHACAPPRALASSESHDSSSRRARGQWPLLLAALPNALRPACARCALSAAAAAACVRVRLRKAGVPLSFCVLGHARACAWACAHTHRREAAGRADTRGCSTAGGAAAAAQLRSAASAASAWLPRAALWPPPGAAACGRASRRSRAWAPPASARAPPPPRPAPRAAAPRAPC
jgi:hypothetical protein